MFVMALRIQKILEASNSHKTSIRLCSSVWLEHWTLNPGVGGSNPFRAIVKMEKIILIGGSPTAGKSYTARRIAEDLKLPWISTDTIREQMRKLVGKKDYPSLFLHADSTSEMGVDFLNNNSPNEIVEIVNKEGEDVWKGVKALIETDYVWGSYIIEGVAIIPKLVLEFAKKNKNVNVLFLVDEDINRVRDTIFTRGLWNEAKTYPDDVKEKEVEWVIEFNEYIKKEAKKYGFPVVNVGNRMDYINEVKKLIDEK